MGLVNVTNVIDKQAHVDLLTSQHDCASERVSQMSVLQGLQATNKCNEENYLAYLSTF